MSILTQPLADDEISVRLPSELRNPHREAIQRYLRSEERMVSNDWSLLIQAMDLLRQAQIIHGDDARSFATIYDQAVDAVYSDRLIEDIWPLADPEFEQMIEAFIQRPTGLDDAIPADTVFAMLDEAERNRDAVRLHSAVVGDRLIVSAPRGAELPRTVREVEFNLPSIQVVVKLQPATQ